MSGPRGDRRARFAATALRLALRAGCVGIALAAAPSLARAQTQALPEVITPTPQPAPPAPPAPPRPSPVPLRCECFLRTPLGPRTVITRLSGDHALGESCQCPFGPPPPDELPSAPALGHVIQ